MHMIRHDAPDQQPVTLTVELQQGFLHDCCQARMAQGAASHPGIQPLLSAFAALNGLPVERESGELHFQPVKDFPGQGIGQTESDKLEDCGGIQVGQISPTVPGVAQARLGWPFSWSAKPQLGWVIFA